MIHECTNELCWTSEGILQQKWLIESDYRQEILCRLHRGRNTPFPYRWGDTIFTAYSRPETEWTDWYWAAKLEPKWIDVPVSPKEARKDSQI